MTEIPNSLLSIHGQSPQNCLNFSSEELHQPLQNYQFFQTLQLTQQSPSESRLPYRALHQALHANPQQDHESYVSTFNVLEMKAKNAQPSTKKLKEEDISNTIGTVSDISISQFQSPALTITTTATDISTSPLLVSAALLSPSFTSHCKTFSPFSQHQFWICSDALVKREEVTQNLEDDHQSLSILSAIREHKKVDYIEHYRKQNCLCVHLVDSLTHQSASTTIFNQIDNNSDLSYSISKLTSILNTLPTRHKYSSSTRQFQLNAIQSVTQKQKPCFSLAYHRNNEGTFELNQLLINEKFLLYTKWDLETYMMSVLNHSVIEMFTDKNYSQILISTLTSIGSGLSGHPEACPFSTELTMKDLNIREVEATVESTYDKENEFLFVVYTIEKVLSERKPNIQKKNNKQSSSNSLKQQDNLKKITENPTQNYSTNVTKTLKRKTPNSFYSEESAKNDNDLEEQDIQVDNSSVSKEDKSVVKKIFSI